MDRSEIEVRVKKVLAEQLAVDEAQVVADALVLAISDRADAGPVRRLPGDHRPGGFGWPIIEHLARGPPASCA